jgi:hypothetical protein
MVQGSESLRRNVFTGVELKESFALGAISAARSGVTEFHCFS